MSFRAEPGARPDCELCHQAGGIEVANHALWRVIRVEDRNFPAFYRVVWHAHVAEFSDLDPMARASCLEVVATVERALRDALQPTKINLASLGNMVPHLHWHVIARFDWDSHFPQPVWGAMQRVVLPDAESRLRLSLADLDAAVARAVG
jgi:diadenosine tetraphosphate (Ap4A) HIT family hydrolase